MSWARVIRFCADWHTAIAACLNLAATMLDRELEVYDDIGAIPAQRRDLNFSLNIDPDAQSAWDAETAAGLGYAADLADRVAANQRAHQARVIGHDDGIACTCSREFIDAHAWSYHAADIVLETVHSLPDAVDPHHRGVREGRPAPDHVPGRREAGRPTNPSK